MFGTAMYRRRRQQARVWMGRSLTPSFARHVEQEIRILLLLAESSGVDPFVLWPFMSKGRGVREFVKSINFNAPKILHGPMPSAELPWGDLPSSFVIKPSTGSSSRGVFVMRRTDDGRFEDLIDERRWSAEELVRQYQERPESWRDVRKDEVLVEELVECGGRPSYDWKVYAFRGEIALLYELDRLGGVKRNRCYLPDWTPVPHVWYGRYDRHDPLPPPTHPDELLRTAAAISLALPLPFVRVDLYESDTGVVVGELTPFPGTRHEHSLTWDRILGEAWERGETALRAAGVPRYQLPPQEINLGGERVGL
jgi:hypothetical protein